MKSVRPVSTPSRLPYVISETASDGRTRVCGAMAPRRRRAGTDAAVVEATLQTDPGAVNSQARPPSAELGDAPDATSCQTESAAASNASQACDHEVHVSTPSVGNEHGHTPCATQAPRRSSRPPLSGLASSCPRRRSRVGSCDPSASGESGPVGHCERCMEMNIALGRAHAALVAAKLETEHYKGLEKRARTNYGQYVKLAKALQDKLDTQTSEINASARGRTQSTNAAGSGPPISRSSNQDAAMPSSELPAGGSSRSQSRDTAPNRGRSNSSSSRNADSTADQRGNASSVDGSGAGGGGDPGGDGDGSADRAETESYQPSAAADKLDISDNMRRKHSLAIAERLCMFTDDVCGDVLARTARRLGTGALQAMLHRKGMPNWWNGLLEAQKKAAAAVAAAASGESVGGESSTGQKEPLKLDRGEEELAHTSRTELATRIAKLLARFAAC
eukprot:6213272-Pleurochrysis_carterae.AAC.1